MKRSIFSLETEPLTYEQILIMRAAFFCNEGDYKQVANYLFKMIPNPVRKDRSDTLASIECDASMLSKLKKLAAYFSHDVPFDVGIEDDRAVLKAEGDYAIVFNALLDANSLPTNVLQAGISVNYIYGFDPFSSLARAGMDLSCDDVSSLFSDSDEEESLQGLIRELDILKIPHTVTEHVLVVKSKLKAKGEIVMNKKEWSEMKAKFTSPVKLIEEVDSLMGL